MLPWNPPSSFTSQSDQTHTFRGSYGTQQQQHQQQQQQQQHQQHQQPQQQQQQPQQDDPPQLQPQQQQQQQQQQPPPPPAPMQPPHTTLASTLHFLQSEHRRYAKDRNEWEIERAEMRARIALLEGEKRGNEGALRDLARRCKMLENALRGERSKFLASTNTAPGASTPSNASGTASPIPGGGPSVPGGVSAAKAAPQLSTLNPASAPKDKEASAGAKEGLAPESVPMTSSTSSAGPTNAVPAVATGASSTSAAPRAANVGANGLAPASTASTGNWGTTGLGAAARDPRGKARSRDYLKQCLQEIHYLTSATTMNPLSSTSFCAPSVPRPRKTLPEQVLPSGPGVYSISLPPSASSAAVPPTSNAPTIEATPQLQPPHVASLVPHPITQFPSDPPSAFVPLKRTISRPGGMPPVSASMESDNQINMRSIRDTTPTSSIPMATSAPSTTLLNDAITKSDPNGRLLPTLGEEAVTINDNEPVDEGIVKPPSPPLEVPLSPVNKATTTVSGSPKLEYTLASNVS